MPALLAGNVCMWYMMCVMFDCVIELSNCGSYDDTL